MEQRVQPDELTLAAHGVTQTQCRWCPQRIGFVLTSANARPMPLDWKANPAGNVRLERVSGLLIAVVVEQDDLFPPDPDIRWMPHEATCVPKDQRR